MGELVDDRRKETRNEVRKRCNWDRIARVVLGVVLLGLGWTGTVDGTLGTVFKFLGLVPLATGLLGWCPIYAIFQFRTNDESSEPARAAR
jgi:hypothetical protein